MPPQTYSEQLTLLEETDTVYNTKNFSSTDHRHVNAIPTKEKQRKVENEFMIHAPDEDNILSS